MLHNFGFFSFIGSVEVGLCVAFIGFVTLSFRAVNCSSVPPQSAVFFFYYIFSLDGGLFRLYVARFFFFFLSRLLIISGFSFLFLGVVICCFSSRLFFGITLLSVASFLFVLHSLCINVCRRFHFTISFSSACLHYLGERAFYSFHEGSIVGQPRRHPRPLSPSKTANDWRTLGKVICYYWWL